MKVILNYGVFLCLILLVSVNLQAQNADKTKANNSPDKNMKQIFIDRFLVPAEAKEEFLQRMKINRNFIKKLLGFIEDTAYEQIGGEGEFNYVTVAVWRDAEAIENAKREVFAMYQKQNFDMPAFLKRLNIKIDRAIYRKMED